MKIIVNYKEIEFEQSTIQDLIVLFRFNPERIRVEKNGQLVPSEEYARSALKEGDVLEIGRR